MQINELAGNGLGHCGVTGERYRYKSLHVGWEEKKKKKKSNIEEDRAKDGARYQKDR